MAKNPPKSATKPPLVSALDREALDYRLKLTLLQLGTLYQDAGGEMSEYIFKQYLPMQVLICALNSGMVEPPYGSWNLSELENKPSEDVVAWYDEFLAFLPVDDCYQEWLEADIWERPTPAQILKRFRIASKLTNERIAEVNKELRAKVNELLEKPESEKLYRSDKLVHNDKGFKEAADRIQAKAKEAVQAKKKAEAEAAHAKKEAAKMEKAIKKLETIVAKKKDSGHEPTPAAIKAHQEFDWDDGENRVRVETFNAKYKALLAKKEVQKKLAKVMHDCGLVNHEAVIRECQPMARKAAA
jgi:hypothetical protein